VFVSFLFLFAHYIKEVIPCRELTMDLKRLKEPSFNMDGQYIAFIKTCQAFQQLTLNEQQIEIKCMYSIVAPQLKLFQQSEGKQNQLNQHRPSNLYLIFSLNVALSQYLSRISTNVQILGSSIKQDIGMQFQRDNNQTCQDQANFQEVQFQSSIIHTP